MRSKNTALALLAAAQFVVVLDASIVNVALPSIGTRPRLRPERPVVGRERLHADVRRLPAARRPPGRPARAAAHLHHRDVAVRVRLAGGRPRPERHLAGERARTAGPRRGADLPVRTFDSHHHIRGGRRAQQGPGRLGRGGRLGRSGRRARRRHAHRVGRMGVGAVRERPDRHRGRFDRPADPRREPGRVEPVLGHGRCGDGHGRARAARVHARRRERRRLGLGADDRPGRAVTGAARPRSS